ncbi:glycosyltransferase family 2 protein [Anaeromyxobacter sp. K]|uniref:glycosyltransferase family 2 protein n=1 Tax=Anaeromyxobacter sp. (strain K) TaxID=447217 RepID=UPI0002D9636A|nr:glycosyltransferase family 2 protein [Anaeromyxobacter sp. K]
MTILTPTLNAERFLPECLQSIRMQSYPASRIQHLVLDGHSSDGTVALARASGAEVSVQRDGGLYEAMNRGIRLAGGDVIGWLNGDDAYEPGAIAAVVDAFRQNPTAEIVVGDHRMAGPEGSRLIRGRAEALARLRAGKRRGAWVVPIATFFRAATLRGLGPYRSEYRYCADLDLWMRAAARPSPPEVARVDTVIGSFRVHAGSLSSGRTMAASARELAALGLRWSRDEGAPPGVRRYGLYVHRRYAYLFRRWEAAPRGRLASLRTAVACYVELRRLGRGALRDFTTPGTDP